MPRVPRRLLVVAVAVAAALSSTACSAPGPSLATVRAEPVLVSPVEATNLGTAEIRAARGGGVASDSGATVTVAYAVDLTVEDAVAAWKVAYDDRYAFDPRELPDVLGGMTDRVYVQVIADDKVHALGRDDSFDAPPAGQTVVTVSVTGRT